MLEFGFHFYQKNIFIAKIKEDNIASIKLFNKLNFKEYTRLEQYKEIHYKLEYQAELSKEEFTKRF